MIVYEQGEKKGSKGYVLTLPRQCAAWLDADLHCPARGTHTPGKLGRTKRKRRRQKISDTFSNSSKSGCPTSPASPPCFPQTQANTETDCNQTTARSHTTSNCCQPSVRKSPSKQTMKSL